MEIMSCGNFYHTLLYRFRPKISANLHTKYCLAKLFAVYATGPLQLKFVSIPFYKILDLQPPLKNICLPFYTRVDAKTLMWHCGSPPPPIQFQNTSKTFVQFMMILQCKQKIPM